MMLKSIISNANLSEMVRLATMVPAGAFVEVGVYKGGSAFELYKIAQEQGRELYLFDTFSGMPLSGKDDPHKVGEFADTNLSQLAAEMPEAKFFAGVYPATHPTNMPPVAFVHCDCDQYASYRAVIEVMWPKVVMGGVLLFDDYPYLPGAKRAVEETFPISRLRETKFGRNYVVKEADDAD